MEKLRLTRTRHSRYTSLFLPHNSLSFQNVSFTTVIGERGNGTLNSDNMSMPCTVVAGTGDSVDEVHRNRAQAPVSKYLFGLISNIINCTDTFCTFFGPRKLSQG